jgi:hypothetical protein
MMYLQDIHDVFAAHKRIQDLQALREVEAEEAARRGECNKVKPWDIHYSSSID